jgi:flagellar protein FliO/FliZ
MKARAALAGLTALAATGARAADAAAGAAPSLAPGLLQATLGLAVVLALIWAAARLARRFSPLANQRHSALRVVARQAVGAKEQVVIVEIADQWLVLGVAPGAVSALQTMPKGELPSAPAPAIESFGRLLARARGAGAAK